MSILQEISTLLQQGRMPKVKELVSKAIEEGVAPKQILEEGLLAGMSVIGEKFKNNEIFVPEVLIAARAMNGGVEILKPYLVSTGVESKGKEGFKLIQQRLNNCQQSVREKQEDLNKLDYYYDQFIFWADKFDNATMERTPQETVLYKQQSIRFWILCYERIY